MLRDGHAARLHLRRRPDRRRDAGDRRRHRPRALPHLLRLGLRDQGAVRRHDRGAAGGRARRGRRGAPAERGRRVHDPARPEPHQAGLRLGAEGAARGGRPPGDRVLPRVRHLADLHPPEGRASELRRHSADPRRRRRRLRRLQPRPRAARARAARGPRRRQPALGRAREPAGRRPRAARRGVDHRRRRARRRSRTTSTTSSTSRPTTATRARWPTRWPTTSTTR